MRRIMAEREPREDEQAALDAICELEDVVRHEWLPESNTRTPDLRVTLAGQREVTVEITLFTNDAARSLRAAERRMRPNRFRELTHLWTVIVSDLSPKDRPPDRTLKNFVAAMVPVLAEAESQTGTPQQMEARANAKLDSDRYHPERSQTDWWTEPWLRSRPLGDPIQDINEWARANLAQHCDYWYPLDILDCFTDNIEPRHVRVAGPPEPARDAIGGVQVHVISSDSPAAFLAGGVDYLVPALQESINKKERRGQMANVRGEKWLVAALEGNAGGQLEGAFGPEAQPPYPDLSTVKFSHFDEVWAIAKVFGHRSLVVLRLSTTNGAPRFHTFEHP